MAENVIFGWCWWLIECHWLLDKMGMNFFWKRLVRVVLEHGLDAQPTCKARHTRGLAARKVHAKAMRDVFNVCKMARRDAWGACGQGPLARLACSWLTLAMRARATSVANPLRASHAKWVFCVVFYILKNFKQYFDIFMIKEKLNGIISHCFRSRGDRTDLQTMGLSYYLWVTKRV